MLIRRYNYKDKPALISIIKLLTPEYFAFNEIEELERYLVDNIEDYYVIEKEGAIIGSGGINYFPKLGEVRISWDLIHPDFRNKGYGTLLLNYRLEQIKASFPTHKIIVRTSQHAHTFYEKNGFKLIEKISDYWAEGYHLYYMTLV